MTQFEFVMTVVSILMSFGLVRLLDGLRASLRSGRRYWVHSLWVINRLGAYILMWWSSWSVSGGISWSLFLFVLFLVPYGLLYLQCTALVTTHPNRIEDWKAHYYDIRLWLFSINIAYIVTLYLSTMVFGVVAVTPGLAIPFFITILISIAACITASHKAHAVIVVAGLVNLVGGYAVQWSDPAQIILKGGNP